MFTIEQFEQDGKCDIIISKVTLRRKNMDKLIPAFKDSLFTSALADSSLDILEIGIDSVIDNTLAQSIPIAKIIVGLCKTAQNIHDRNLLKQTLHFIREFNNKALSEDKIEKHKIKLNENPSFAEDELGRVMILLNSHVDKEKAMILAKLYRAYVNEQISWESFCEYSEVISRMFVSDFALLMNIHKNKITETSQCKRHQVERLTSLGLVTASMSKISVIGNKQVTDYYVHTNHFGNILCNIILQ